MKNVVKKLFFLVFLHNKNRDIFNKARWKSYENIFFSSLSKFSEN